MLHTTNFPYEVVGNDSTYFLNKVALFCDVFTRVPFTRAFSFVNCVFPCGRVSPTSGVLVLAIVHFCDRVSLCRVGFANGIPVGDNFQKAYLEEWLHIYDDSTGDPGENSIDAISTANVSTTVRSSENQNCTVRHKQPMDAPSETIGAA